jgi:hypothetical protein
LLICSTNSSKSILEKPSKPHSGGAFYKRVDCLNC